MLGRGRTFGVVGLLALLHASGASAATRRPPTSVSAGRANANPCTANGYTISPCGTNVAVAVNAGNQKVVFTVTGPPLSIALLACAFPGTGNPVATCTVSSPTLVLLGGSAQDTVTYTTGPVPGSGQLQLTYAGTVNVTGFVNVTTAVHGVTVVAAAGAINGPPSTGGTAGFAVTNTGSAQDTFAIAATCSGSGISSTCTPSRTSLVVAAGGDSTINVTYTTTATAGAVGAMHLAASRSSPTVGDTGWSNITVVAKSGHGVVVSTTGPGTLRDPNHCLDIAVRHGAAVTCGDFRYAHALPSVRAYNRLRTPVLLYQSEAVRPYLLFPVNVTSDTTKGTVDSVTVRVHSGGTADSVVIKGNTAFLHGGTQRVVLGVDQFSSFTSVGTWTVSATTYVHNGSNHLTTTDSTSAFTEIESAHYSHLGRGFTVAGLEALKIYPNASNPTSVDSASLFWTTGGGDVRYYQPVLGSTRFQWATRTLDRVDSISYNSSLQQYTRLAAHRVKVVFDALGRHIATIDRLGHQTVFKYLSSTSTDLDTIQVMTPAGSLTYTFYYNANALAPYLDSVTAPGSAVGTTRKVVLVHDTTGKVNAITDPDGTTETLHYLATPGPLLSAWSDKRGTWTTVHYDTAFKVKQVVVDTAGIPPLKLTTGFRAAQSQAYHQALAPDSVFTTLTDPRGNVTRIWLDQFDAPIRLRNALGYETLLAKANGTYPALVTRLETADQRVMSATYDNRGNVASETDSSHVLNGVYATTRYNFDPTWDFVTNIVRPDTDSVSVAYDPSNGNRLWQEPAGDSTRRVRFFYWPAQHSATGLVSAVGLPVEYQLQRVDSIYYDTTLADVVASVSPKGFRTTYLTDGLGRLIRTRTQLDSVLPVSATTHWRVDSTGYDVMDRVILAQSYGPPDTSIFNPKYSTSAHSPAIVVPGDTVTVATVYVFPSNGQADTVKRQAHPDRNAIGPMVTSYVYDAAGRMQKETAPDGFFSFTTYDPNGNVVGQITRRNNELTFAYDALNRLITSGTPLVETAESTVVTFNTTRQFPLYSNCGGFNYCSSKDNAVFGYDKVGRRIVANNADAQIARTYNRDGTLATDTLRVRTYAGGDFTQHVYGIGHTYDLDGRRSLLNHPAWLAPVQGGVSHTQQSYDYNRLNQLTTVIDVFGNFYTLKYDLDGRLYRTESPGTMETKTFDADGRMVVRTDSTTAWGFVGMFPGPVLHYDSLFYDARGNVIETHETAAPAQEVSVSRYSALGTMAHGILLPKQLMGQSFPFDLDEEFYVPDALGNTLVKWGRIGSSGSYADSSVTNVWSSYSAGTGRLVAANFEAVPGVTGGVHIETYAYDESGNRRFGYVQHGPVPNGTTYMLADVPTAYYYDAAERLRALDKQSCEYSAAVLGCAQPSPSVQQLTSVDEPRFEEYFYDALGRRVLMRSRDNKIACDQFHPSFWPSGCLGYIQRTVYDRDQVLYEIRMPGDDSVSAARLERDTGGVSTYFGEAFFGMYGRVTYTHGIGVDAPLSVIRMGYSQLWAAPVNIVPHTNWRGAYDFGTFINTSIGEGVEYDCTNYSGTLSGDTTCINPAWLGPRFGYWRQEMYQGGPLGFTAWMGSLVANGRDLSNQLFRRNRYLDPQTQTFTQEDPIGLAGGLNAYGFAGGDPVNYDDPFGLCKVDVRYAQLGSVGGKSWNHAYVVTTSPDNTRTYFRGGPSGGGPSGGSSGQLGSATGGQSSGASGSNSNSGNSSSPGSGKGGTGANTGPWGAITTESGAYVAGTIDYDSGNPASQRALDNDVSCDKYNASFATTLKAINAANIPYNPIGNNSNAVAHTILGKAGLSIGEPSVWAPGWDNTLTP
jgi:RHS repeat-associated protein